MRLLAGALAACAVAAVVLFRPAAPPVAPAAWSTATPLPHRRAAATPGALVVYVAGEVRRPGVYRLPPGARAGDALARAGGARPGADLVAVNLAAPLRDGDEVVVRRPGVPERAAAPARRATHRAGSRPRSRRAPPPDAPIDLNGADAAALAALPGVGPALAGRIVAYRDANGPFASADELLDVAGITERRYAELAPYVTVR